MKEKTRQALENIIELSERLGRYKFKDHIKNMGIGFRIDKTENDEWVIDFKLPNEEVIDASLIAFRQFDIMKEDFSFYKLDTLALDKELSEAFQKRLISIKNEYLEFLSDYPKSVEAGFFDKDENPNQGEIMRVVLYGFRSHKNSEKLKKYMIWSRDEIREGILISEFTRIVYFVLGLIEELSELSKKELDLIN